MKKILLTLGLAAVVTGLQAQGLVSFYSFAGTLKTNSATSVFAGGSQTGGTSGVTSSAANSFYYTVLIAASSPGTNNPAAGGWTQALYNGSGIIGTNYAGLTGDMQGPKGTSSTPIDNWGSGNTMSFIIVGWSSNLGSDWTTVLSELNSGWANIPNFSAANSYFFGVSSIGSGASGTPPTGTPLSLFTTVGSFNLYSVGAVPEPGTIALAGLGIASLFVLRRKK